MGLLDREHSEKKRGVANQTEEAGHAGREVKVKSHTVAHRRTEMG